jgi:hypothetical protein
MRPRILAAGISVAELRLEVRFLQREPELAREAATKEELHDALTDPAIALVVLGPGASGDWPAADLVPAIRRGPAGGRVSILTIVRIEDPIGTEGVLLGAGANAALRRPLDRFVLESWMGKLLDVPRRVIARIPVHVQVVGSRRSAPGEHFYGLSRNLSLHGMLLASPVRIEAEDLDLELDLAEPEGRVRLLGRIVRDAPEVGWPYVGYGIEFLFLPEAGQRAIQRMVRRDAPTEARPSLWAPGAIHSTVRRDSWIYEITEPARTESGFLVEIRRAPLGDWRPGRSSPYSVVRADEARAAIDAAREFVRQHG